MSRDTDIQEVHLLGFSQEKLDKEVKNLSSSKGQFRTTANHMFHGMHAHPIVAKIDEGKIVEYNTKMIVPKDWIINPETSEIDKSRLPEKRFETPYKSDGITIDGRKLEELLGTAKLNASEQEREWILHHAHHIVHKTNLVAASEKFYMLRDTNGILQPSAGKYNLPPLGAGHVPVPSA